MPENKGGGRRRKTKKTKNKTKRVKFRRRSLRYLF
jgi:hypothetical protein